MNAKKPDIDESWWEVLQGEFEKPYFYKLKQFLINEKSTHKVFPLGKKIFAAFNYTPFDEVKAVLLGQDPYHGYGQANGLCFSVSADIRHPASLQNIFKELHNDLGIRSLTSGDLSSWAKQGVLLLNTVLTVRERQPGSHKNQGWENFTTAVIETISEKKEKVIFILWGKFAQSKKDLIDPQKHYVLEAAHPSPYSANNGFFGCCHFSKTNDLLISVGKEPIDWQLA